MLLSGSQALSATAAARAAASLTLIVPARATLRGVAAMRSPAAKAEASAVANERLPAVGCNRCHGRIE